jgi:hypothetical protein
MFALAGRNRFISMENSGVLTKIQKPPAMLI